MKLPIEIINRSNNPFPKYETENSSGLDLRANLDEPLILKPLERVLVPTGIFIAIPHGYEAQVRPRSGLAYKFGISVLNTPGTIDADYRGEIKVILVNLSNDVFKIEHGERVCQLVFAKVEQIDWVPVEILNQTDRGSGGFGHTGKN